MADPTDFHDFNRYEPGDEWDYNPDFEKLDTRLELRGALEDRPSTAPDGAKFEVDEPEHDLHGAVYLYDDTSGEWMLSDRQVKSLSVEVTEITERDEQPTEDDLPVGFYQMNGQLIARTEE